MIDNLSYNIKVDVQTKYLPDESDPESDRFAFSYTITIHNRGTRPTVLLSRHWKITNAAGETKEVKGKGVIGEQPQLRPGESFRYTSGAIINTPIGIMAGSYTMLADDGIQFEADIPAFRLAVPEVVH